MVDLCSLVFFCSEAGSMVVQHATDSGWYVNNLEYFRVARFTFSCTMVKYFRWGKGIYVSPSPSMSWSYGGGQSMFVVMVTRGRVAKLKGRLDGGKLQSGFDSHEDPSGQEWVLFDGAQCVPIFLLTISSSSGGRRK